jgi:D-serine deaminase-like pyridoxal phosphate-dependent protein
VSEVGRSVSELETPSLWIDLDGLDRNIEELAAIFKKAKIDWRPHTKGIKVPAIAQKAIDAGAIGVTCAKLGEAEVMAAAGIGDILVANEVVGPRKIARLVNVQQQADVMVAVDDALNVAAIGKAATEKGVEVRVLVEVETGMERAGTVPGQPTVDIARVVHETPGVTFEGLMAWEGQAVDVQDPTEKRQVIEKAMNLMQQSVDMCVQAGLPVNIVSGGGSGTYLITPSYGVITEIQAGGAMLCDNRYIYFGVETKPCIFARATVTSRPTPTRIILDGGFKSMPAWPGAPTPLGLNNVEAVATSAEHVVIELDAPNTSTKVGDGMDFILGYTDATVCLHDQIYGVRNGIVETEWAVQGRGKLW